MFRCVAQIPAKNNFFDSATWVFIYYFKACRPQYVPRITECHGKISDLGGDSVINHSKVNNSLGDKAAIIERRFTVVFGYFCAVEKGKFSQIACCRRHPNVSFKTSRGNNRKPAAMVKVGMSKNCSRKEAGIIIIWFIVKFVYFRRALEHSKIN